MKKSFIFLTMCLTIFALCQTVSAIETSGDLVSIAESAGYKVKSSHRPKAAIVIDAKSGDILFEENINLQRDPASLSKLMTLYMLYEEMAKGEIDETTTLTATATDQAISKIYEISNNKIVAGVAYPLKDLIIATLVPSSNASTIMIANYLSNNDADVFIDKMNQTAKKLGMTNTVFNNASGAVASAFQGYYKPTRYDLTATNKTTAKDLAILVHHFLKKYPQVLNYTKKSKISAMVGTPYQEDFNSYNYSLPDNDHFPFKGVDGLKTGSSPSAAFNGIMTAKQDGVRLITVVLGVGDWSDQDGEYYRHPFINGLLKKGFSDYGDYQRLKAKGASAFNSVLPSQKKSTASQEKEKSLFSDFFGVLKVIFWVLVTLLLGFVGLIAFAVYERKRRRRLRQQREKRQVRPSSKNVNR